MKLPGWIKQAITEDDANSIVCPIRLAAIGVVATFIGCAIFAVIKTHTFDAQSYGIGAGGVLGAAGLAIGAKAKLGA